jgi:hypothetical protein
LSEEDIELINSTNIGYKIIEQVSNNIENEVVIEEVKPKVKKLRIVDNFKVVENVMCIIN